MKIIPRTIFSILLSLDLLASALSFGAPWQTVSARMAKSENSYVQKVRTIWDKLMSLIGDKNHCAKALEFYEIIKARREAD